MLSRVHSEHQSDATSVDSSSLSRFPPAAEAPPGSPSRCSEAGFDAVVDAVRGLVASAAAASPTGADPIGAGSLSSRCPWDVLRGRVTADSAFDACGDEMVKNRRLLRVRAGLYGGGYVMVVNCSGQSAPGLRYRSAAARLTRDSRQFLPTPGAPSIRILMVGFGTLLPILASWIVV